MFVVVIMVYLVCIFFIGVFWWFCEINWVIGLLLLILVMFEGYFGYLLFDDLLLGFGLCVVFLLIMLGMLVIGIWLYWVLFGGDFFGIILIFRFYVLYILLLLGIILVLIGLYLVLVWF